MLIVGKLVDELESKCHEANDASTVLLLSISVLIVSHVTVESAPAGFAMVNPLSSQYLGISPRGAAGNPL